MRLARFLISAAEPSPNPNPLLVKTQVGTIEINSTRCRSPWILILYFVAHRTLYDGLVATSLVPMARILVGTNTPP